MSIPFQRDISTNLYCIRIIDSPLSILSQMCSPHLPNTLGSIFAVPASHLIEKLLPQIRSIVRCFDVRMESVDDVGSFSLVDIFDIRLSNDSYQVIVSQNLIDRDHERRELCSRVHPSSPHHPG